MKRIDLESLAFWEGAVCLDCGAAVEERMRDSQETCDGCDGSDVWDARTILKAADFVEEDDR